MLKNTPNQKSKFKTKNWVEVNDEPCGLNFNIKTSMLSSSLCYNSDAYKHVSATPTVPNAETARAAANNRKKINNKKLRCIY